MDNEKKFLIGDYVKGKRTFNGEVIEGKFNGFHLYNKLNPKSVVGVIDTDERCYDVSVDSIELVESEDKKWRNWLIGHLKGYINQTDNKYAEVCKKAIAWLEKKEPSQQRPLEWREEDKRICETIITDGENKIAVLPYEIDWLKSLKYRHTLAGKLNAHWKPSEKQMKELQCAAFGQLYIADILASLYEDLQKL